MNYTVVTAKVDPQTKKRAQETAQELGMPLSVVIKAFLKQFIRTKSVSFSMREEEIPNQYFLSELKHAREDRRKGKASPIFRTGEETIAWLKKQGI